MKRLTETEAQAAYNAAVKEHGKGSILAGMAWRDLFDAKNRALRRETREDRKKRRKVA